jgi:hypothetical protein
MMAGQLVRLTHSPSAIEISEQEKVWEAFALFRTKPNLDSLNQASLKVKVWASENTRKFEVSGFENPTQFATGASGRRRQNRPICAILCDWRNEQIV